MQFDEAREYLLSLGHETLTIKLGLANIERLLEELDHPHHAFPAVQIAGTNGKGSTAAMLEAICCAAGITTGLYTSPHLVSITERIRIAGREISQQLFSQITARVRLVALQLQSEGGPVPTFFEQVTAIALAAFREMKIELAILETGLGGRLDATTAARAAVVAITPVALDHQEYLGPTLTEIAAEKAAVIRPGVTEVAVIAPQPPEAAEVIEDRCRECGVEPRLVDMRAATAIAEARAPGGRLRVTFKTKRDIYENVLLALRGRHQIINAATAIALAEALGERGFPISRAAIIDGLEAADHAGRLELHEGTPPLLFDGAHNPAGARALRAYLDEFVSGPLTLIFGAMRDKDLHEIAATLFPAARRVILTRPTNARAASSAMLARIAAAAAGPDWRASGSITLAPTTREALRRAREQTPHDGLICITGSLYLVGEVKLILENGED